MGKKCSATRRAVAAAAPALAPTASPTVTFDMHTTLVDMPPASAVREPPTTTQQPRVSHETDATRTSRAAAPAQPTINASLVFEPASTDVRATRPVAIAMPQTHERRTSDSCPEPHEPLPALTMPISMSNDISAVSAQRLPICQLADTINAAHTPFATLSTLAAAAVADLVTAIDAAGPPTVFLACPVHLSCHAEDFSCEPELLAPRTSPAMSVEEIDKDLLNNIIEDAQNEVRIEIRREVRLKALAEGRERGWKEGLDEGKEIARREVRRDARAKMRQQEQGWKDAYELGRWAGYREGLEVARTEVSTSSCVTSSIQTDDTLCTPSPTTETSNPASHVDTGVQFSTLPHPLPSLTDSRPPIPLNMVPATPHTNADVQTDNPTPTLSPPACACNTTPHLDPATLHVDAGIQSDAPARALAPTTRVHVSVQADSPAQPNSPHLDSHTPFITGTHTYDMPANAHVPPLRTSNTPHTSAHARARIVQEIEPGLLTEILAKAIAKGEAAGVTKGKHVGFQDGMEASWQSGTRKGRADGFRDGLEAGIVEGYERH